MLTSLDTHQTQPLTHLDEVCVIANKGTRSAQVDNAAGFGTLLTVGVNVRHDIVAHLLFLRLSHSKINIVNVRA